MVAYEVRLENGASISVPGVRGFGAAVDTAVESLLGCMPEGTQRHQVVAPTIVRRADQPICALCGIRKNDQKKFVVANLPIGHGVLICMPCAVVVTTTARCAREEVLGAFKG